MGTGSKIMNPRSDIQAFWSMDNGAILITHNPLQIGAVVCDDVETGDGDNG